MTAMMGRLVRANQEPVSPPVNGLVDPSLMPLYGNQLFASQQSMFSPPTYMHRLDKKLLPTFDGSETSYVSFKENFIKLTAAYDKSYLQMLLASERVVKNKDLRLQLQQISTHAQQWV